MIAFKKCFLRKNIKLGTAKLVHLMEIVKHKDYQVQGQL
jgi:hypothetical protein